MEVPITFNLPDDKELLSIYFHAPRRARDIADLHQEMKNIAKHGINNKYDTVEELADYIYRQITWEYVH